MNHCSFIFKPPFHITKAKLIVALQQYFGHTVVPLFQAVKSMDLKCRLSSSVSYVKDVHLIILICALCSFQGLFAVPNTSYFMNDFFFGCKLNEQEKAGVLNTVQQYFCRNKSQTD